MNNPQVAWRLELARRLAATIRTFAGVRAVMVVGSVARGWADEYSDLEIAIFWEPLPRDQQRLEMVAALGGEFLYAYDGPAQEDQLLIGGFQVDLWQNSVAQEEALFAAVLHEQRMGLGESNFMDSVRAGVPLYGEELLAAWKARAAHYPRELAAAEVRGQLPGFHSGYLDVLARRDALHAFFAQVVHLQQAIFRTLLALNREYFPTYKWMLPVLERLTIRPQDAPARFRQALTGPPEAAAQIMFALLDETLGLVETHLPEVDTTSARQRLAYHRAAFTRPPESHPPQSPF